MIIFHFFEDGNTNIRNHIFAEVNPEDESDVPLYNKQDAGEETTPGTLPLFEVGKLAVTADIKNAPGKYHFRNGQFAL